MYMPIRKLLLLLFATAVLAPAAHAVVTYNLTASCYCRDGISVERNPDFVDGTRGDFVAGFYQTFVTEKEFDRMAK